MNWRLLLGHWMMAKSKRHSLAARKWRERAEKVFSDIKGFVRK